jgi:hypothetical protein
MLTCNSQNVSEDIQRSYFLNDSKDIGIQTSHSEAMLFTA